MRDEGFAGTPGGVDKKQRTVPMPTPRNSLRLYGIRVAH